MPWPTSCLTKHLHMRINTSCLTKYLHMSINTSCLTKCRHMCSHYFFCPGTRKLNFMSKLPPPFPIPILYTVLKQRAAAVNIHIALLCFLHEKKNNRFSAIEPLMSCIICTTQSNFWLIWRKAKMRLLQS